MDKLKLNSALAACANTMVSADERENLIMTGRMLVLECMGRAKNRALTGAGKNTEDFGSLFKTNGEYATASQKFSDDLLYFCAKRVHDEDGKPTDRNDRRTFTSINLAKNPRFLHMLSVMMNEIMYPVTPYLISEIVGEMASVVTVDPGKTYTAAITSNAVIQWEDATWTSLRSVPQDRLYAKTITLNPQPFAARASINWYQMVGNGMNLVDTMAALAGGYAAKVMRKFTDAFNLAAADTRYVPAALTATGYTDDNWATLCQKVAMANRVRRDQLIAYGDFLALRKVLPNNAALASAIMMQLGNEYFKNGYIMSHDGVLLYEIHPVAEPNTINTTLTPVWPTDEIIIAARATDRYAPMIMAWENDLEMGSIDLTAGDDIMATGRIEVEQYASAAISPAFASRVGLMTNIV